MAVKIIIISAIFSCLLGTAKCKNRVIGMAIEDPTMYPFFAQLLVRKNNLANYKKYCGASLVHPSCILTAAHCLPSHSVDKRALQDGNIGSVYMGSTIKFDRQNSKYTKITNFTIHPNYTYKKLSGKNFITTNDIAVCKLRNKYQLSDQIQLIPLASPNLNPNVHGQLIGIGEKNVAKSKHITAISVDIQDSPSSKLRNPTAHGLYTLHDMGFTGYPASGDSGGPLIHTVEGTEIMIQFGVFVRMVAISRNYTVAHYESVQHHINFIKKAVKKWCGDITVYPTEKTRGEVVKNIPAGNIKSANENRKSASGNCCVYRYTDLFFMSIVILYVNRS